MNEDSNMESDCIVDSEALFFQVEVFWVVSPCNVVVGYRRFGSPCCLHRPQISQFYFIYVLAVYNSF